MARNDYGLSEVRKAWLKFQSTRDKFESSTFNLRERYVSFMSRNIHKGDVSKYIVTPDMHLDILNPEEFDDKLLFLSRDSIFGIEHHYVPVAYFADPEKWEKEYLEQVEEEKAKDMRRSIRIKAAQLNLAKENLRLRYPPKPQQQAKNHHNWDDTIAQLEAIGELLIREVTECGGETSVESLREMVGTVSCYSRNDINAAITMLKGRKALISDNKMIALPGHYEEEGRTV